MLYLCYIYVLFMLCLCNVYVMFMFCLCYVYVIFMWCLCYVYVIARVTSKYSIINVIPFIQAAPGRSTSTLSINTIARVNFNHHFISWLGWGYGVIDAYIMFMLCLSYDYVMFMLCLCYVYVLFMSCLCCVYVMFMLW